MGINVHHAVQSLQDVGLTTGFNIDETLHDGIGTSTFECRKDGEFVLRADSLFDALHDREDNLSLLSFFTTNGPNARVIHSREEQSLGNHRYVSEASAGALITVSLSQDLCLFLGIHARVHVPAAIELAMSSVIVNTGFRDIVWMIVGDEVSYLFAQ